MYRLMYMTLNKDKFGVDKLMKEMDASDLHSEHIEAVLK